MSLPLHVITTEALALDPADRLRLANELIDSVEGPADPNWTRAWSEELNRRVADADVRETRGEARGEEWEKVRADLLREIADE